jgi:hypothetical protein
MAISVVGERDPTSTKLTTQEAVLFDQFRDCFTPRRSSQPVSTQHVHHKAKRISRLRR